MQIEVRPRKIKTGYSNPDTLRSEKSNSRFSHDVTKIQTKGLVKRYRGGWPGAEGGWVMRF